MILISVDLPAPFSPTSARTSPVETEKSTRSSDRTPGKDLEMALTSTTIEGFWELQGVGEAPGRTMTYARQAHVTSGSRPKRSWDRNPARGPTRGSDPSACRGGHSPRPTCRPG